MTAYLATLYHSILCDYCIYKARFSYWFKEGYINKAEYHLKSLYMIEAELRIWRTSAKCQYQESHEHREQVD